LRLGLASAIATWLIAKKQNLSRILRQNKPVKTGLALLGISIVLFLSVFGASASLHKLIHPDADSADHHCAITLFAHSQVASASGAQSLAVVIVIFGGVALLADTFVPSSTDYCFSASRAPPVRF
jgi:hypothetical protein